ncbi:hypothetical protein ACFW84_14700 [Streptomyces anulatus]|uniref:hypothetical protein n=1 Tax=Streptomyces anulatus TaxID=1892 RepID=UPI0036CB476E
MTERSAPASRGVFLGIHDYERLPELEGVAKNIPALLAQLTDPEVEALGRGDCDVLSADSTRSEFFEAVSAAADEASDLLLIYFAAQGAEELLGRLLSLELDAAQVRRLDVHLRERKAPGGRASGEATSARRLREDPAFGYVGGQMCIGVLKTNPRRTSGSSTRFRPRWTAKRGDGTDRRALSSILDISWRPGAEK